MDLLSSTSMDITTPTALVTAPLTNTASAPPQDKPSPFSRPHPNPEKCPNCLQAGERCPTHLELFKHFVGGRSQRSISREQTRALNRETQEADRASVNDEIARREAENPDLTKEERRNLNREINERARLRNLVRKRKRLVNEDDVLNAFTILTLKDNPNTSQNRRKKRKNKNPVDLPTSQKPLPKAPVNHSEEGAKSTSEREKKRLEKKAKTKASKILKAELRTKKQKTEANTRAQRKNELDKELKMVRDRERDETKEWKAEKKRLEDGFAVRHGQGNEGDRVGKDGDYDGDGGKEDQGANGFLDRACDLIRETLDSSRNSFSVGGRRDLEEALSLIETTRLLHRGGDHGDGDVVAGEEMEGID